jgi:hypothetical protein
MIEKISGGLTLLSSASIHRFTNLVACMME